MAEKMKFKILTILLTTLFIGGCHQWDDFTTYFNTFYNLERLLKESREEFEYQGEKKRIKPRVLVPEQGLQLPKDRETSLPPFLDEFIVTKQERQPVNVKLDSMIIKGSKILAKHPKSSYVQNTLYLMAVSYFYQNLWLNTQIKCGELIDRFPEGELSPDAHILLAKSLLIQRKFEAGKLVLSRTVDVAWLLKRYDILSEAFRIQAELAMFENDYDEAVKPYKQAIIQSEDEAMKAKWQFDLAALVFRMGKFEKAEKLFENVRLYDADYLTQFESYLYQASCLSRIGEYEKAEQILLMLENDGKFEEWKRNVFAERMNIYRLKKMDSDFQQAEIYSDTSYIGSDAIAAVYYEKGLDFFNEHDYSNARLYFGKCRSVANPGSKKSAQLFKLLDLWSRKRASIVPMMKKIEQKLPLSSKEQEEFAGDLYEMGRVQEKLSNRDSAEYYYQTSIQYGLPENKETARYYYAYARFLENSEPLKSDSLMEIIIERYPLTDYGQDAIKRLGYTEKFLIDSVAELYSSAVSLWKSKEWNFAIAQLTKLFNLYPHSKLAPKAIYTIGWIYEKDFGLVDIAYEYYQLLSKKYPKSEYANNVRRMMAYTALLNSGEPLPDTLKNQELKYYVPNKSITDIEENGSDVKPQEKKSKLPTEIDTKDLLNDPLNFLKKTTESATDPDALLEEPKSLWNSITSPDSLKKMLPGLNINDPLKDLRKGTEKTEEKPEEKKEEGTPAEPEKKEQAVPPKKEEKEIK